MYYPLSANSLTASRFSATMTLKRMAEVAASSQSHANTVIYRLKGTNSSSIRALLQNVSKPGVGKWASKSAEKKCSLAAVCLGFFWDLNSRIPGIGVLSKQNPKKSPKLCALSFWRVTDFINQHF